MDDPSPNLLAAWDLHCQSLRRLRVGKYGGGEGQRLSETLLQVDCPSLLHHHNQEMVLESIEKFRLRRFSSASDREETRQIIGPEHYDALEQFLSSNDRMTAGSFSWQGFVHVCSQNLSPPSAVEVETDTKTYNLMLQSLLLDKKVRSGSIGCQSWPLIGLFEASQERFRFAARDSDCLSCFCGDNQLELSDQHCHWVVEQMDIEGFPVDISDWHFGGDMARFSIAQTLSSPSIPLDDEDEAVAPADSLVAVVDVESRVVYLIYLLLVEDHRIRQVPSDLPSLSSSTPFRLGWFLARSLSQS